MNIATQLDYVMRSIWDDGGDDRINDIPSIKALTSYVKTHNRRNPENVFEVIDILWPRNVRTMQQRPIGEGPGASTGAAATGYDWLVDVQFDDDSQILIICQNGIGHGLEWIS